ncbi:MAG: hypothetical protein OEZ06_26720 [Myxococcales bacterium]|nr:hypothetical protein [Myxococcales bacterium]
MAHASEVQTRAARDDYHAGVQAFERGDFASALELFERSDAAVTSPNTRLMIGRSLLGLGQHAAAYMAFAQVVRQAQAWGNQRYHAAAQSARNELESLGPMLAMLEVHIADPGGQALLEVGGMAIPRQAWNEAIPADPGVIEVVLVAGERRQRRSLELAAGVAAVLKLEVKSTLDASEPSAEAGASVTREPAVELFSQDAPSRPLRTAAYVAGGVGIAALGAFGVLGALTAQKYDQLEEACPGRIDCDPALRSEVRQGQQLRLAANGTLIGAVVSLATAAVFFMLDDDPEAVERAFTASQLRGSF